MSTKFVEQSVLILDFTMQALEQITDTARVCYQRRRKTSKEDDLKMIRGLIQRGHETPLEVATIRFHITTDRAVSHALVRHRVGVSFCQESTHYIDYTKKEQICFIKPHWTNAESMETYKAYCERAYNYYAQLIKEGCPSSEARIVLPMAFATNLIMTMNARELRHFLKLRALGTTGKDQSDMQRLAIEIGKAVYSIWPWVIDDFWKPYDASYS